MKMKNKTVIIRDFTNTVEFTGKDREAHRVSFSTRADAVLAGEAIASAIGGITSDGRVANEN